MKKFLFNLKLCFIAFAMCLVGASNAFADTKTGTIKFGSATGSTKINGKSVTGDDDLGNTWTITTDIKTESYTQNSAYSQVGASSKPATSITFTTTLPEAQTIKSFSAKFGGNNGTAGTITLNVGDKTVGSGKLDAGNDVTVSSTSSATGTTLTVSVSGIKKGVKVYYITYSYDEGGSSTEEPVKTLSSISVTGTPEAFKVGDSFNRKGMTVTANYSDNSSVVVTDKANFSTPDMTTAGEKTITVTYEGKSATYKINVAENITIANTKETAYTTADAINLIKAGEDLDTKVYVKGTVSKVDSYSSKYKSITYWLDNNTFEVYGGISKLGKDFASKDDVKVGAEVIVLGNLKKFTDKNGKVTYELDTNNELVDYVAPVVVNVAPSFTTEPKANASYTMNANATNLTVKAEGTPEPTFQWYKNTVNSTEGGVAIDGATSTSYKPSTNELGTTYYYCVATNSVGSKASNVSAVTVKASTTLTLNGNLPKLNMGEENTYTVEVISDGILSVNSNNTNIAEVKLDGNKVTVKASDKVTGEAKITIQISETAKYKANHVDYTLSVVNIVPTSLDFTFDDGKSAVKEENGMSHNGLGSDYSASPKLKFDDTDDYMLIAFNQEPDVLCYDIKGNNFSGGTFDVFESADNKTYTLVKSYTKIEGTQKESVSLKSASRFVKFVYTEKKSGNVGLGAISITKKVAEPEIATEPKTTAEEGAAAWAAETYTREVATGKLSTICLPYDAKVEGAIVYALDGKVSKGGNVQSLNFVLAGETEEESNILEAGTPYLYKATANTQTFTKTGKSSSDVAPKASLEGFVGTYKDFMLPIGEYFLYSNGDKQEFRKSGDSGDGKSYVMVRAFKCYISSLDDIREVPEVAVAPYEASRRLVIGTTTDESTGITTLDTDSVEPANGKYVENGRVVVVKNGIKYNINGQRVK
ncbi:MAG: bacterial Ig-like domain-containing protein [Bacteroidaceae bacterium]|nr:bacterial Ig-like domain-containing protein [Bacteroidaceae bacterium]